MRYGKTLALGLIPLAIAAGARADEPEVVERHVIIVNEADPPQMKQEFRIEQARSFVGSNKAYWLGLQGGPMPESLKVHLKLPEPDGGLLVQHVFPEGPSAKAGIHSLDIVIGVNGEPVKKTADFFRLVNASQGKEVDLLVLQKGQPTTIKVTPVEREKEVVTKFVTRGGSPGEAIRETVEAEMILLKDKIKDITTDNDVVRTYVVQPGVKFAGDVVASGELRLEETKLPDDVTVRIKRQGSKPAEIEVNRGDKSWNIKEDEIKQLPEDLRPQVNRMLGKGLPPFVFGTSSVAMPAPIKAPAPPRYGAEPSKEKFEVEFMRKATPVAPKPQDKQLEEMSKSLEQMQRQVDQMRKQMQK